MIAFHQNPQQKGPKAGSAPPKEFEAFLKPQWGWPTHLAIFVFVALSSLAYIDLEVDLPGLISTQPSYIADIIGRMLPPDFSNFNHLVMAMVETIEIALLGTLLAIALSIPMALLSARNITLGYKAYLISRTIIIFFRALPEFIVAMILVIAIGFGPILGILALGFHTMGFLAKFYAEAIEHINESKLDALRTMGASMVESQVFVFGVIPQILPSFVANNFYIFDRNIRMATMLGCIFISSFRMQVVSATSSNHLFACLNIRGFQQSLSLYSRRFL